MAAIMIGSTGNGKSALGNFLLNPVDDDHLDENIFFKRAVDNIPCTQETKTETATVSSLSLKEPKELTLIDTPGLNESNEKDLEHMIGIVNTLKEVPDIHACFIVVKFDGKIDIQYKNTLKYYSRLLPALFEKNLVIVMTGFDCSPRADKKRKNAGTKVDVMEENTKREIVKECGITCDPMLFKIDSLPDRDELEKNLNARDAIINYVFSREPVKMTNFTLTKPVFLKDLDETSRLVLEKEIEYEQEKLSANNKELTNVMKSIGGLEKDIREIDAKLQGLKREKCDRDTYDYVDIEKWSVSKGWELFSRRRSDFDISSEFPQRRIDWWDNGNCSWSDYEVSSNRVKGHLKSDVWSGLYASVTYQTYKRDKYVTELRFINQGIDGHEVAITSKRSEIKMKASMNTKFAKKIEDLDVFIKEREDTMKQLAVDRLTIDEANERLKEIKGKSKAEK